MGVTSPVMAGNQVCPQIHLGFILAEIGEIAKTPAIATVRVQDKSLAPACLIHKVCLCPSIAFLESVLGRVKRAPKH